MEGDRTNDPKRFLVVYSAPMHDIQRPLMDKAVMTKAYLQGPVSREEQEGERQQVRFCEFSKDARYWTAMQSAEIDRDYLNQVGIEIPSVSGGTYVIRDFEIEELGSDHYVIFAYAPFVVREGIKPMGDHVGSG
jgi:hypothetical protein